MLIVKIATETLTILYSSCSASIYMSQDNRQGNIHLNSGKIDGEGSTKKDGPQN